MRVRLQIRHVRFTPRDTPQDDLGIDSIASYRLETRAGSG